MDAAVEHALELGAGAGADRLDPLPAFAEHDRALARPLDIDHLLDAHAAVRPVLPLLGLDRRGVGQLVMQLQKDLLARDLGRDQRSGASDSWSSGNSQGPGGKPAARCRFTSSTPSPVRPEIMKIGSKRPCREQRVGQAEQAVAADQVDLVQREDRPAAALGKAVEDAARVVVDAARGVDQQHRLVGILGARPGRRHHRPVEPAPRRKDARAYRQR